MKDGPDIARLAALIADPARANMLAALMGGQALTARELAAEAGVTPATASGHLARLAEGGLIAVLRQGRHAYARISGPEAAGLIEALMGFAAGRGLSRTRPGPRDAELRAARRCYNHLAGRAGVAMLTSLRARNLIAGPPEAPALTPAGAAFMQDFGIDPKPLAATRGPLCRACLDWSERQHHLAGPLGRALLARIEGLGWLVRDPQSRALRFTPPGRRAFGTTFPTPA